MVILPLPTSDDRAAVETAVNVFLWTQKADTRQSMLRAVRAVLDRYGLRKLTFHDYVVESATPGWSAIRGRRNISGRECPDCGADIYEWPGKVRILSVQEGFKRDVVSYGCKCGAVFMKAESV